jgi:hypothetical protein
MPWCVLAGGFVEQKVSSAQSIGRFYEKYP